jgi:predicted nucleotidyltransferase
MGTQGGAVMAEMLKLDDKIPSLSKLFPSLPQGQTVFLFGSYGTEYQSQHSDIDFAVYFDRDITVKEEAAFLNKLSIALGTDRVDLLNLNKAPLILQFNAVAEGRII